MVKELIDKVIDISRVSDKMMAVKVVVHWIIISVILFFVPKCRLHDQ